MRVRMAAQCNSAGDTMEWCPQDSLRGTEMVSPRLPAYSAERWGDTICMASPGGCLDQCKKKWFCYRAMRTRTVALVLCALAIAACKKPSDQQQPGQGGSTPAAAAPATGVLIGATLPLTGSES